jgi:uncharacterized protein YpbB
MMETNETIPKPQKKPSKIKSPFDKEGSFKYLQKTLRRMDDKLDEQRRTLHRIVKGLDLSGQLIFDRTYLEEVLHMNEADRLILTELSNADQEGRLPRDVATALNKELKTRHYQRWHVRFALYRMNRELEAQIGEVVAEKRHHRWALTPFARKAWKLTKQEFQEELEEEKEETNEIANVHSD